MIINELLSAGSTEEIAVGDKAADCTSFNISTYYWYKLIS